jgi:GMP synthase (glutamine-hydrolysing)
MEKIYIIKAGSTFADTTEREGDFDDLIYRGLGLKRDAVEVIEAYRGEPLPPADTCLGVVISGAHCMVTDDLPWSLAIETWIPSLVQLEVPLFGICYGHQLLGRAMGGRVDFHPDGKEVGTFDIYRLPESDTDPLFASLPQQFPVHATHAQSVLSLPKGAVPLTSNSFEPHHAFRVGRCAWGVQFHPEYNAAITKDYILAQADDLRRAGQDVAELLQGLRETPIANSLLPRFAQFAMQARGEYC